MDKYGTINVFQAEIIKNKCKRTMFERYGVSHPSHLEHTFKTLTGRISSTHRLLNMLLSYHGFETIVEGENIRKTFSKYNTILNKQYCPIPDIVITKYNTVIEINGDYWHAHPRKYKPHDYLSLWGGATLAKDIWRRDLIKFNHYCSLGYTVIVVWESELLSRRKAIHSDLDLILNTRLVEFIKRYSTVCNKIGKHK